MAQRRKRHNRRSSKRRQNEDTPGWVWGVLGLAVGLSVAAAVWMSDRDRTVAGSPPPAPASLGSAVDDNGETERQTEPVKVEPEIGNDGQQRFTFYELLKRSEVVVPEEPEQASGSSAPAAVVEPGTYVLQVGSFSTEADADRRRAELALHGIESRIQKVSIDGKIYHRVRIGPTDDLDRLNMLRSRLRAAQIDAVRLREID